MVFKFTNVKLTFSLMRVRAALTLLPQGARFCLLALTMQLSLSAASAQGGLYLVPESMVTRLPGAIQIQHGDAFISYVEGLGWLPDGPDIAPVEIGGRIYLSELLLEHISVKLPRLTGVRLGEQDGLRIVLDLANMPVGESLSLAGEGSLAEGEVLSVELPEVLVPAEGGELLGDGLDADIEVVLDSSAARPRLLISGPATAYRTFFLAEPSRVVIDLTFPRFAEVREEARFIREGVRYRRFAAPTRDGSSGVHVLEIAPGRGRFKVVGQSLSAEPLSRLARGGLAAINAGYFDTESARAIGLLRVGGVVLSLPFSGRPSEAPFLGRASIGFGSGAPVIDRVRSELNLRTADGRYPVGATGAQGDGVQGVVGVHLQRGETVGSGRHTLVVVGKTDGRVIYNGLGPQTVPDGGFVVVYEPEFSPLGRLDPGAPAALEPSFTPPVFDAVHDAVEGGPLLIYDGLPAYNPDAENFIGDILTKRTQQAAIGVRADGTVLFVTADAMVARDLIPLFQSLGADRAMRLDSGGSATLYADGRVLNRRLQRPVVSAIVYLEDAAASRGD
jgi:hypothetical protein